MKFTLKKPSNSNAPITLGEPVSSAGRSSGFRIFRLIGSWIEHLNRPITRMDFWIRSTVLLAGALSISMFLVVVGYYHFANSPGFATDDRMVFNRYMAAVVAIMFIGNLWSVFYLVRRLKDIGLPGWFYVAFASFSITTQIMPDLRQFVGLSVLLIMAIAGFAPTNWARGWRRSFYERTK